MRTVSLAGSRSRVRVVEHYDYYTVFAGLRFGLILSRIMFATGQDQEVQGNFAVQMLQTHPRRKTRG